MELEAKVERELQVVVAERVLDESGEPSGLFGGLGGGDASLRGRREHPDDQVADRPGRGSPERLLACFSAIPATVVRFPIVTFPKTPRPIAPFTAAQPQESLP